MHLVGTNGRLTAIAKAVIAVGDCYLMRMISGGHGDSLQGTENLDLMSQSSALPMGSFLFLTDTTLGLVCVLHSQSRYTTWHFS